MKITRRDAIVAGTTFVATTAAEALLLEVGTSAFDAGVTQLKTLRDPAYRNLKELDPVDAERLTLIRELFYDRGEALKLAGGRAHPLYVGDMHPDDRIACQSIRDVAKQMAHDYVESDTIDDQSFGGSFLCTGSPVSNAVTRDFMEFEYVDDENPRRGLTRREGAKIKLPILPILSEEDLAYKGAGTHSGQSGMVGPNWSLSYLGDLLAPEEDTDFLLITRLPNFHEERSSPTSDFNNSVTVLSGCHGVGTAAVPLLFENLTLLKKISWLTKEYEYWQAIVKVDFAVERLHPVANVMRTMPVALSSELIGTEQVQVRARGSRY